MNEAVNGALLVWSVVTAGGVACLWYSPDALRRLRLRMRAREHALLAARFAYAHAYTASYVDDARAESLLRIDREVRYAIESENVSEGRA